VFVLGGSCWPVGWSAGYIGGPSDTVGAVAIAWMSAHEPSAHRPRSAAFREPMREAAVAALRLHRGEGSRCAPRTDLLRLACVDGGASGTSYTQQVATLMILEKPRDAHAERAQWMSAFDGR
jgi:hypothetical protein